MRTMADGLRQTILLVFKSSILRPHVVSLEIANACLPDCKFRVWYLPISSTIALTKGGASTVWAKEYERTRVKRNVGKVMIDGGGGKYHVKWHSLAKGARSPTTGRHACPKIQLNEVLHRLTSRHSQDTLCSLNQTPSPLARTPCLLALPAYFLPVMISISKQYSS